MLGFCAAPRARAQSAVVLDEDTGSVRLGRHLGLLEDKAGTLTIGQVSQPGFRDRFVKSRWEGPNFGFTSSVYWVRFTVRDRAYLFVVLQILSTTIFQMTLDGISFEYLWPRAVAFANVALPLNAPPPGPPGPAGSGAR